MKNNYVTAKAPEHGLMEREETERILSRLQQFREWEDAYYILRVGSSWSSDIRWGRNRASMTSDRRTSLVVVTCVIGRSGYTSAYTNQTDDISLEGVFREAERRALKAADQRTRDFPFEPYPLLPTPKSITWSDRTVNRSVEESAQIVSRATTMAEKEGLLSAGYIESHGMVVGMHTIDPFGRVDKNYSAMTQAQCSTTVRHADGTASGWAGLARYDLNMVDEEAIAARSVEKCILSLNPVRIEPGRYTVILEPQAVAEFVHPMFDSGTVYTSYRVDAEGRRGHPYYLGENQAVRRLVSKIGLKIVDERVTVSHDPSDPELGILGSPGTAPIKWIDKGVLTEMQYSGGYGIAELNDGSVGERRMSFRMEGGSTSMDEMIASTPRGLLVTRFSRLTVVDKGSLLTTGVTRDGLWLIENGKISHSVRNFRISESPLFALNNLDQLGVATAVYRPFHLPESGALFPVFALSQVIVPPLKVHDFSFTSSVDAI